MYRRQTPSIRTVESLTRAVSHFGTLGTVSTICLKVANYLSYSRLSGLSCLSL